MKKILFFMMILSLTLFAKDLTKEMLEGRKFAHEKWKNVTIEFDSNNQLSGKNGLLDGEATYFTHFDIVDNQLVLLDYIIEHGVFANSSEEIYNRQKLHRTITTNQKIELNGDILTLTDVRGIVQNFKEIKDEK